MWNKKDILDYCWDNFNLPAEVFKSYDNPNRHYHSFNHIIDMVNSHISSSAVTDNQLFLAIMFHDIVYNPKESDNEYNSAAFFRVIMDRYKVTSRMVTDKISDAILQTKYCLDSPSTGLGRDLVKLDLEILNCGDIKRYMDYEHGIFKEYQWVDLKKYKFVRLEILKRLHASKVLIDYMEAYKPKIGLYAGSFNPFHKGHLNILEKAEKVFDKVIIARGINPEKEKATCEFPNKIMNRQVEKYDGLITDFIKGLGYPVTLIRGLRDANDLLYESTQISYLKDLMPEVNVIEIICDREFNHISSSAIRNLKKYSETDAERYIV